MPAAHPFPLPLGPLPPSAYAPSEAVWAGVQTLPPPCASRLGVMRRGPPHGRRRRRRRMRPCDKGCSPGGWPTHWTAPLCFPLPEKTVGSTHGGGCLGQPPSLHRLHCTSGGSTDSSSVGHIVGRTPRASPQGGERTRSPPPSSSTGRSPPLRPARAAPPPHGGMCALSLAL